MCTVVNDAVTVSAATADEAPLVAQLLQLYLHELSEWKPQPIGPDGNFCYPWLALYWKSPRRYPYLFRSAGGIAGFALVREKEDDETADWAIQLAEFFILHSARRRGVGFAAARHVINQHPGLFEISYDRRNLAAGNFWRRIHAGYETPGAMPVGEQGERYLLNVRPLPPIAPVLPKSNPDSSAP
jgi:predicted acetyltransferase